MANTNTEQGRAHSSYNNPQALISIGRVCKLCGVTSRTLRYYEELGIITSKKKSSGSSTRYYDMDTIHKVFYIRYLVDVGYSLAEIDEMLSVFSPEFFLEAAGKQLQEIRQQIRSFRKMETSLQNWEDQLNEGMEVLRLRDTSIKYKHYPVQEFIYCDFSLSDNDFFSWDTLALHFMENFKKSENTFVSPGSFFTVMYDYYSSRINNTQTKALLMLDDDPSYESNMHKRTLEAYEAVTCYHIGPLENIHETYETMIAWAKQHNFDLEGKAIERYVHDSFITKNENEYVTEIILPVK